MRVSIGTVSWYKNETIIAGSNVSYISRLELWGIDNLLLGTHPQYIEPPTRTLGLRNSNLGYLYMQWSFTTKNVCIVEQQKCPLEASQFLRNDSLAWLATTVMAYEQL